MSRLSLATTLIQPKHYQSSLIQKDGIKNFVWNPKSQVMTFVGSNYLWVWNPAEGTLKRRPHMFKSIINLLETEKYYWLIGRSSIERIDIKSFKRKLFDLERFGSIMGANLDSSKLRVLSETALLTIDEKSSRVSVLEKSFSTGPASFFLGKIWIISGGLNILDSNGLNLLVPCKNSRELPKPLPGSLMYRCDNLLYRVSDSGKLLQVIPNNSSNKLVSWSVGSGVHAYQFKNKTLEVYSNRQRKKNVVKLRNSYDSIFVEQDYAVGITNGRPSLEIF